MPSIINSNRIDFAAEAPYYKPQEDGSVPGFMDTNPKFYAAHPVTVIDIRGREHEYTLDTNGFTYLKQALSITSFDDETVKSKYLPEMMEYVKNKTGAKDIFLWNFVIRGEQLDDTRTHKREGYKGPLVRPHTDIPLDTALDVICHMVPDSAELIKKRPWQIINTWRPILPVQRDPLAMLDHKIDELNDTAVFGPAYNKTTGIPVHRPSFTKLGPLGGHKWRYLSNQQPEDLLLFKSYDSNTNASRRNAPHCSFHIPGTEDKPTRESIETRFIVVY